MVKYSVRYELNDGTKNSYPCKDYREARSRAESEIHYGNYGEERYTTKAEVIRELDNVVWQAKNIEGDIYEKTDYSNLLECVLDDLGYEIHKFHDGFGVVDKDVGNHEITEERTLSATDLIHDIEREFDIYYETLTAYVKQTGITGEMPITPEEWIKFLNNNVEIKEQAAIEYDAMKMLDKAVISIDDRINLLQIPHIVEDDLDITKDSPHYVITSYYGGDFRGIESTYQSYSWSKIEEEAHSQLMQGLSVIIEENRYGGRIEINADEYISEWENNDLCEFPYKPEDITATLEQNNYDGR